ncbi:extracellular solute-binding protein [Paenibacillus nasutitermitis]|uniref:Aldouronate transport system substrate-binding protein n=1 Tax=Paenibacillus nasutitermitis TaxID=1652958 RepID=A0A917DQB9_9BACL|nr:extracellular solute-binding protein [Paenibacillus nasutitermitis]GGD59917.1 hypothetical protein GCM10010911_17220 [Paenibacillus nasutitermitis]
MEKKLLKAVAAVMICSSLLMSACSNNGSGNGKSGNATTGSTNEAAGNGDEKKQPDVTADPMAAYDPPIEISMARGISQANKFRPGEDISNNPWIKEYASRLGINVKYSFTASSDGSPSPYTQKLNVNIASAKLPDIFTVDSKQFAQLSAAGKLADLSEIYEQTATDEIKENYSRDKGLALKSATQDGKLYGLPVLRGGDLGAAQMIWIRTDWLTKLNLPEPKSMDDLWAIAEAFTNNDPDGNGKNDTYGIAINKEIYSENTGAEGFFQGYHAYPGLWVKDASGQLAYGSIQPEIKTVLAKLNELYKKGVIDREFGVKDVSKINEDIAQNKLGIISGINWSSYYPLNDGVQKNPEMDWKPFPILSADDKQALVGVPFNVGTYLVVRKDFANPEALVKMVNLYFEKFNSTSPEDFKNFNNDSTGDQIVSMFSQAATMGMIPINYDLTIAKALREALASGDSSSLQPDVLDYYNTIQSFMKGDRTQWATNKQRGAENSSYVIWEQYNQNYMLPEFYGAPTKTMNEKWSTLQKMEKEIVTRIIMGAAPAEEYDSFISKWKELGGDMITNEVNEWKSHQQ